MSRQPSLNGEFNGPGTLRWAPPRPRHANAYQLAPDRTEVEECRRILGSAPVDRMVEEIEARYTDAEGLGAARDRELWGDDPFELEG